MKFGAKLDCNLKTDFIIIIWVKCYSYCNILQMANKKIFELIRKEEIVLFVGNDQNYL